MIEMSEFERTLIMTGNEIFDAAREMITKKHRVLLDENSIRLNSALEQWKELSKEVKKR